MVVFLMKHNVVLIAFYGSSDTAQTRFRHPPNQAFGDVPKREGCKCGWQGFFLTMVQ